MLMYRYLSMGKSDMQFKSKKRRIILLVVIVLVLAGGGAAAYFGYVVPSMKTVDNGSSSSDTSTTGTVAVAHQKSVKQTQTKIDTLVQAGGTQSIKQADQIAESEVTAANSSGDDAYIVNAGIAKASLLITTSRAQEALDTVLFPLDKKYGMNETYRYDIYASISWAYRYLENTDKATEYFQKIPGKGWN